MTQPPPTPSFASAVASADWLIEAYALRSLRQYQSGEIRQQRQPEGDLQSFESGRDRRTFNHLMSLLEN